MEVIVPGKALEEVSRLLGDAETISFGFSENQVILEFGDTVYVSRRIEGSYPPTTSCSRTATRHGRSSTAASWRTP